MHAHGTNPSASSQRALAIGIAVNALFVAFEVAMGIVAGSLALFSDAAHNAGDVLGLVLAWVTVRLAQRPPTLRRTYGLRRSTVLAALANAAVVLAGVGVVVVEAVGRIGAARTPNGAIVLVTSAVGVAVNAAAALPFLRERRRDANLRAAFVHLAADAAVSLGVVVAGALITVTGFAWLDPVVALVVSAVIVVTTMPLLRDALDLALDAVPRGVDPRAIRRFLLTLPGVEDVHDLHIWPLSTTETAVTAHLVTARELPAAFIAEVTRTLAEEYDIRHATLQIEPCRPGLSCGCPQDDRSTEPHMSPKPT